ncbi:hypothetical protein DRO31_02850 [Candidatus Bathyarchaeota archaeon]|nr:MAG: hypothetical protein DRO31_02850 [Candidatus Bathyarchaeota archaeon]
MVEIKMQEITLENVQDLILETQQDKGLKEMYIHKSPCSENGVGAVFFALGGNPPRGYAMYLPDESGKKGALHVFDNLGLKRKIIHCVIMDLGRYEANDVWHPHEVVPQAHTSNQYPSIREK